MVLITLSEKDTDTKTETETDKMAKMTSVKGSRCSVNTSAYYYENHNYSSGYCYLSRFRSHSV